MQPDHIQHTGDALVGAGTGFILATGTLLTHAWQALPFPLPAHSKPRLLGQAAR